MNAAQAPDGDVERQFAETVQPFLTAHCTSCHGGANPAAETGRSLDYLTSGDDNRKMCSLFLGIMDRMGIKLDSFGDATTRLTGL